MNDTTLLLTIIGMGLVTYGLRLFFIVLSDRITMPQLVQRGLNYVPPAIFSAIIFPDVFMPGGQLNLSMSNPYLLSGLIAALVAWYSKNVFLTIAVGMIVLWL